MDWDKAKLVETDRRLNEHLIECAAQAALTNSRLRILSILVAANVALTLGETYFPTLIGLLI